jgi:hypothetical protein
MLWLILIILIVFGGVGYYGGPGFGSSSSLRERFWRSRKE